MKVLINLLAVAALALPLNVLVAAEKKAATEDKAKECCKRCDDENCKKACKSGHGKKGHCESKTNPLLPPPPPPT